MIKNCEILPIITEKLPMYGPKPSFTLLKSLVIITKKCSLFISSLNLFLHKMF